MGLEKGVLKRSFQRRFQRTDVGVLCEKKFETWYVYAFQLIRWCFCCRCTNTSPADAQQDDLTETQTQPEATYTVYDVTATVAGTKVPRKTVSVHCWTSWVFIISATYRNAGTSTLWKPSLFSCYFEPLMFMLTIGFRFIQTFQFCLSRVQCLCTQQIDHTGEI